MILPTWIVSRLYSLSQFFNTIMKTRMHYSSFKPLLYITMGNDSEKFILSSFICFRVPLIAKGKITWRNGQRKYLSKVVLYKDVLSVIYATMAATWPLLNMCPTSDLLSHHLLWPVKIYTYESISDLNKIHWVKDASALDFYLDTLCILNICRQRIFQPDSGQIYEQIKIF